MKQRCRQVWLKSSIIRALPNWRRVNFARNVQTLSTNSPNIQKVNNCTESFSQTLIKASYVLLKQCTVSLFQDRKWVISWAFIFYLWARCHRAAGYTTMPPEFHADVLPRSLACSLVRTGASRAAATSHGPPDQSSSPWSPWVVSQETWDTAPCVITVLEIKCLNLKRCQLNIKKRSELIWRMFTMFLVRLCRLNPWKLFNCSVR